MALREEPRTQPVAIVKLLLDAGCDALKRDLLGKQPMHVWKWILRPEVFADVARMLTERGALCSYKDFSGRNVLHNQIRSKYRMKAVLDSQLEDVVKEAMESVDEAGDTPFSMCMNAGKGDSAAILAGHCSITPSMLERPTSFLRLVVTANAEKLLDVLPCFDDAVV